MDLKHSFTVPATIDETWAAFNDIESVAGCFPGAVVTSVEGDSFEGTCKVKLGPIALVYKGEGTFIEKDEAAHVMKIDAKGKDKRGNGTAGAKVTATLTDNGGSTTVEVITDLNITGKPAQFGRGVMQDVSDKLLGQFVDCLQTKVGSPAEEAPSAPGTAPATGATPDPSVAGTSAAGSSTPTDRAAAGEPPAPEAAASSATGAGAGAASPPGTTPPPMAQKPAQKPTQQQPDNDALDLGATVIPILLKAYWKPVAAVVVVLVVLFLLIRNLGN